MTLPEFITDSLHLLQVAASGRDNPLRTPVLTTVSNTIPYQRIVVLRRYSPEKRQLLFYTDIRSNKVEHLRENSAAGLLFWHPDEQLQIRIRGRITVEHRTPTTQQHYAELPAHSLRTYATRLPPGTPSNASEIEFLPDERIEANFALLRFEPDVFEFLKLNRERHYRAQSLRENNAWTQTWLVP